MQNQAVILNVIKDLPFNGSRWILEILRQAQNDEIKGFAKPSTKQYAPSRCKGAPLWEAILGKSIDHPASYLPPCEGDFFALWLLREPFQGDPETSSG
ncbi:hypothetical protein [Fodinibius halophilus]|uniref:Uncharacterized protein n=1 Tax=Fodinibius halophilus TaxID=1736908 RepID=A0A6M1T1U4_9BACT|nr:hypothetical protein [Fodinibius halophilus]NGP87977.1 hypothetical protein [Fodinibius halophilus]